MIKIQRWAKRLIPVWWILFLSFVCYAGTLDLAAPVNPSATYDADKWELQRGNTEYSLKLLIDNPKNLTVGASTFGMGKIGATLYSDSQGFKTSSNHGSGEVITVKIRVGASADMAQPTTVYLTGDDGTGKPNLADVRASGTVTFVAGDANTWKSSTVTLSASLTAGTQYHLVYVPDVSETQYVMFLAENTSGYPDGQACQKEGAAAWTAYATWDFAFELISSAYPTDSPVIGNDSQPCISINSGNIATVYEHSNTVLMENAQWATGNGWTTTNRGTGKYLHSVDNGTRGWSSIWTTIGGLKGMGTLTGQYWNLKCTGASDGTQPYSIQGGSIRANVPSGGGGGARIIGSPIIQGVNQ